MHRWRIKNVVMWKWKQKEWCRDCIENDYMDKVIELCRISERIICIRRSLMLLC